MSAFANGVIPKDTIAKCVRGSSTPDELMGEIKFSANYTPDEPINPLFPAGSSSISRATAPVSRRMAATAPLRTANTWMAMRRNG